MSIRPQQWLFRYGIGNNGSLTFQNSWVQGLKPHLANQLWFSQSSAIEITFDVEKRSKNAPGASEIRWRESMWVRGGSKKLRP